MNWRTSTTSKDLASLRTGASWPVRTGLEQSGVAADEGTSALQHRFALGTSVPAASSLPVSDPVPGGGR
jgi:hypothetical protein